MDEKETKYIDSDIIVSEGIQRVREIRKDKDKTWNTKFYQGTLKKLHNKYRLVTSILTRYEVRKNVKRECTISYIEAGILYRQIMEVIE